MADEPEKTEETAEEKETEGYESPYPDNPLTPERINEFVRGEITLQELHRIDADQLTAVAKLGESMIRSGKLDTARTIFEGLTALNPHLASFHTVLGGIYLKQGEFEKSIEEYTAAIERNKRDVAALTNRGELYLRMGKLAEASQDLAAAIEEEKDLPPAKKSPMGKRAIVLALALKETVDALQEKIEEAKSDEG
jgi:tetratricopeptide (TPR) repeat protein